MRRVQIRLLKSHEEFRECERIQKTVWGTVGVSSEVMTVTQKYGGVVLGAVLGGKCVGFLYAFLARRHGQLIQWSHMMAVEPEFRDLGLGFRMKLAHRQQALDQGLSSICWTYDPLQSRNAALNVSRLGGRVEDYLADCYGHFSSVIERGLPSDRFVVNWRIASPAVERRLREGAAPKEGQAVPRVNETAVEGQGFLENCKIFLALRHPRLLVEIPVNTDGMRAHALDLARRWRMEMRKVFQRYFAAGYRVEDFLPPSPASDCRCFYVLRRVAARSRKLVASPP